METWNIREKLCAISEKIPFIYSVYVSTPY